MSAAEHLAGELLCLAFCWRLDRRDGVTIGLTSHDRDLSAHGLLYRAAPGLTPSSIARGAGLDAEDMDLKGALTSDAISAADLEAGRWDGAALRLHLTGWDAPGALWLELARGELGAVERAGDAFTVELRGPASALEAPVAPETSPTCRAELGDARCRVDLAPLRRIATLAGGEGDVLTIAGGGLAADHWRFGRMRWLTGRNAGFTRLIRAHDAASVTLDDPPPFADAPGALVELTQGCDRRMESCANRFANAANFRGEPNLPGNDLLSRYPGA